LLFFAFFASSLAVAPLHLKAKAVPNHYIVVFQDTTSSAELASDLAMLKDVHNLSYTYTYDIVLKGFAAHLDKNQLLQVQNHPRVSYVEQDQVMKALQCTVQSDSSWGLTRVSQRQINLNNEYPHSGSNPDAGSNCYIIDTGIYTAHNDFNGRAVWGFSADPSWSKTDDHGHGTHVASTVGGTRHGVCKAVNLIAVRVLGPDGFGTTAGVIAGVNWCVSDNNANGRGRRAVGNMSLGGGLSTALNSAVNAASLGGVIIVAAAGNDNRDACNGSPASATNCISVGASSFGPGDGTDDSIDTRAYFSNYGRNCVHTFAPGEDINGAWIGGPTQSRSISGTSMASPHVAGVAILTLAQHPDYSFAEVRKAIVDDSTANAIDFSNCNGVSACLQSPNLVLHRGCQ